MSGFSLSAPRLESLLCTELFLIKKCLIASQQASGYRLPARGGGVLRSPLYTMYVRMLLKKGDKSRDNEKCALTASRPNAAVCACPICFTP